MLMLFCVGCTKQVTLLSKSFTLFHNNTIQTFNTSKALDFHGLYFITHTHTHTHIRERER